jgi:hypothetical protein
LWWARWQLPLPGPAFYAVFVEALTFLFTDIPGLNRSRMPGLFEDPDGIGWLVQEIITRLPAGD